MSRGEGLDLTGPEADDLLRPAAELAIEMAQAGARLQPPLDVPRGLRPLLGHAKLTRAAVTTARRVLESDVGFRARVATAVEAPGAEATLGRAAVLWLSRPEGWEDELAVLVSGAKEAAMAGAEQLEERSAKRRLQHAEKARERAERSAEEARRAAEAARVELQEERRLRRAADEAVARTARHIGSLEEQLAGARRRADAALAQVAAQAQAEASDATALASAEGELRELGAEVATLRAAVSDRLAPTEPQDSGGASLDVAALAEAVAAASSAAVALGGALGRAAAALGPDAAPATVDPAPPPTAGEPAPGPTTRPRSARSPRRGTHRRPVRLPPFVLDDSPEAADHLVNLPDVAVLVDGYNATISTWPELSLPEQRARLVDALVELAARTSAHPEVVFDGAEVVPGLSMDGGVRSLVKVSFTAPEVEADDVLIARAHALPLPVVVASDDRRVRDGALSAGANVLGIAQLLSALRRRGS